ncbi:hypothetical protein BJX99DRAFT_27815 [Aspergillus californicus]
MEANTTSCKIAEVEGDLFDAPDGAALIHACNCQGSWGNGIAKAFKTKYPAAFSVYQSHCKQLLKKLQYLNTAEAAPRTGQRPRTIRLPEGSALIIPPQNKDYERPQGQKHWVICLFTSRGYGRRVSSVKVILENTRLAVVDMKRQLGELGAEDNEIVITGLRCCRFNSGLFGVDWRLTRAILVREGVDVTVVSPPKE